MLCWTTSTKVQWQSAYPNSRCLRPPLLSRPFQHPRRERASQTIPTPLDHLRPLKPPPNLPCEFRQACPNQALPPTLYTQSRRLPYQLYDLLPPSPPTTPTLRVLMSEDQSALQPFHSHQRLARCREQRLDHRNLGCHL